VLAAEGDHVAAARARVEQQRHGEVRLGSERVPLLELLEFVLFPGVKTFRLVGNAADVARRVGL
jgi:hypothetical protein